MVNLRGGTVSLCFRRVFALRALAVILLALAFPYVSFSAGLVNINTADATTLETLPGIGPSKAATIIAYRQDNGPFATVEAIQNVSGIGPVTFANIRALITVAGDATPLAQTSATSSAATSSAAVSGSSGDFFIRGPSYTPPASLTVEAQADASALVEQALMFSATVSMKGGAPDARAQVLWSFGDGSSAEGNPALKLYHYPGTYLASVTARDGDATARDELTVTVRMPRVRIATVADDGIMLANDSENELDLSGWKISSGERSFRLPEGMRMLPASQVLVPTSVMRMSNISVASLAYPSGKIAATYPAEEDASAAEGADASSSVPASPQKKSAQADTPTARVRAVTDARATPALSAPPPPRALGTGKSQEARVPLATSVATTETRSAAATLAPPSGAIVRSPWFLGFLGLVLASGGALLVL